MVSLEDTRVSLEGVSGGLWLYWGEILGVFEGLWLSRGAS